MLYRPPLSGLEDAETVLHPDCGESVPMSKLRALHHKKPIVLYVNLTSEIFKNIHRGDQKNVFHLLPAFHVHTRHN